MLLGLFNDYDIRAARKQIKHIIREDPGILDQFMCGDEIEKTSVYVFQDRVEIHRQRKYYESQGGEIDTFRYDEIESVSLTKYLKTRLIRFNFKPNSTFYVSPKEILQPRSNYYYFFPNEVVCGTNEKLRIHLSVIQKAISEYGKSKGLNIMTNVKATKTPMVFISHSSKDKAYVNLIVKLLKDMGFDHNDVFCSSIPGYDIAVNEDIFDTLRNLFEKHELYVIFVHSSNFYGSPVCLNEMGAAWVLRKKSCSLLLPGFDYVDMKGVVGSGKIAIKLDADKTLVKKHLNELYKDLTSFFYRESDLSIVWEEERNDFIDKMNAVNTDVDLEKRYKAVLNQLYESLSDYRDALNIGDQIAYNKSYEQMDKAMRETFKFAEKYSKYEREKSSMCMDLVTQYNRFVSVFNIFSNSEDRMSEKAQRYAFEAEKELKHLMNMVLDLL